MLPFVTGQLGIMLFSTYFIKPSVTGHLIISCREHARTASEYSLMVYLDLFLATVFTKTCQTLSCTSEKNSPLLECLNTRVVPSALCTRKTCFGVLLYVTFHLFVCCSRTECSQCHQGRTTQCHIP